MCSGIHLRSPPPLNSREMPPVDAPIRPCSIAPARAQDGAVPQRQRRTRSAHRSSEGLLDLIDAGDCRSLGRKVSGALPSCNELSAADAIHDIAMAPRTGVIAPSCLNPPMVNEKLSARRPPSQFVLSHSRMAIPNALTSLQV